MATTNFVDGQTVIEADWLNDVDEAVYNPASITLPATSVSITAISTIAATDVQGALAEIVSEKVATADIGTTVQAYDALLASLAGQTVAANKVQAYSAADTATLLTTGTASGNIPLVGTKSATEALPGLVELATTGEAAAGLDTDRAVTAAGVAAAITAIPQIKAWAIFDGTAASPITITAGYNVTNITKNASGDYTVNFTNAISDANYAVSGVCSGESSGGMGIQIASATRAGAATLKSTTQVRVYTNNTTGLSDVSTVCIQVVR